MIYTVGYKVSYDLEMEKCRSEGRPFRKASGGSVWETFEDAKFYLDRVRLVDPLMCDFDIYAVDANWEEDTVEVGRGSSLKWRGLVRGAEIVGLARGQRTVPRTCRYCGAGNCAFHDPRCEEARTEHERALRNGMPASGRWA